MIAGFSLVFGFRGFYHFEGATCFEGLGARGCY